MISRFFSTKLLCKRYRGNRSMLTCGTVQIHFVCATTRKKWIALKCTALFDVSQKRDYFVQVKYYAFAFFVPQTLKPRQFVSSTCLMSQKCFSNEILSCKKNRLQIKDNQFYDKFSCLLFQLENIWTDFKQTCKSKVRFFVIFFFVTINRTKRNWLILEASKINMWAKVQHRKCNKRSRDCCSDPNNLSATFCFAVVVCLSERFAWRHDDTTARRWLALLNSDAS